MAATVVISFECRDYQANNGKIVLSCEVSGGDTDAYDFYIGVNSPALVSIKDYPVSADVSALTDGGKESVTVSIPLDDSDDYLGGDYEFTIRRHNTNTNEDETDTFTYTFTPNVYDADNLTGVLSVTTEMNCLTGVLTAEDANDYDALGLTYVDRTITITPPSIDPQAEASTPDASETMSPAYTNAPYQVLLNPEFTWDSETSIDASALGYTTLGDITTISKGTLLLYKTVNVECEAGGVCGSLACIQAEIDEAYTRACKAGGYANLSSVEKDRLSWAVMNLAVAKMTYDCGNVSKSLTYIARAKAGLDCDCGCSDTSTDTPVPYTPPA